MRCDNMNGYEIHHFYMKVIIVFWVRKVETAA